MAYVYRHRRNDTSEIFYIGIGNDVGGKYLRAHWKYRRNRYWSHIFNKHGITVEIVCDSISWNEACAKEKSLIAFYGRINLGSGSLVNLTDGGDGAVGLVVSEITRQRLRLLNTGRKLSNETKNKISEGNRGKVVNESTRNKLRIANKGKKQSVETLSKLSRIRKNKKISERHKSILVKSGNDANTKIILNTETGIFYFGFKDAAYSVGKKRTTLNAMLKAQSRNSTSFVYA